MKKSRIFLVLLMMLIIVASAFMFVACTPKEEPDDDDEDYKEEPDEFGMLGVETDEFIQHFAKSMMNTVLPGEAGYDGYNFFIDVAGSYTYKTATSTVVYSAVVQIKLDTAFGTEGDDSKFKISLTEKKDNNAEKEIFGFYYSAAKGTNNAVATDDHIMYINVGGTAMQFPSLPLKDFVKMIDGRLNPAKGISAMASEDIPMPEIVSVIMGMLTNESCRLKPDMTAGRFTIDFNVLLSMLMPILQGVNDKGMEGIPAGIIDEVLGMLSPGLGFDDVSSALSNIPIVIDVWTNFTAEGKFKDMSVTIDVDSFDFNIAKPEIEAPTATDGEWLVKYHADAFTGEFVLSKFSIKTNTGANDFYAYPNGATVEGIVWEQMNPINFEAKANLNFVDSTGKTPTPQQGTLSIKANINPLGAYILADANATRAEKEKVLGTIGTFQIIFKTKTNTAAPETLFNVALGQFGSTDVKETSLFLQIQLGKITAGKISVGFSLAETIDALMLIIPKLTSISSNIATMSEEKAGLDITDLLAGLLGDVDLVDQLLGLLDPEKDKDLIADLKTTYLPMIQDILKDGLFLGVNKDDNFQMKINLRKITDGVFGLQVIKDLLAKLPFKVEQIQDLLFTNLLYGYDTVDLEFTSFEYGKVRANNFNGTLVQQTLFGNTAVAYVDGKDQTNLKKTVAKGDELYAVGAKINLKYIDVNAKETIITKEVKVLGVKGFDPNKVGKQTVTVYFQTLDGLQTIMTLLAGFGLKAEDLAIIDKYPIGINSVTYDVNVTA